MGKYRKKSLNQQTIIKQYNIVNNNYYINNEDKDNIQDKNSSSEKTINKDKDEIDILNEPNFFCQNIINLILQEAIKNGKMYVKIINNGTDSEEYQRFKIESVPMLKECGIKIEI